ncbi:MAG: hypothetical protein AAGD14_18235 [Planctomycetota bacterium]
MARREGFFGRLFSGGDWGLGSVEPPWGDRPSIYEHVRAHVRDEPGISDEGELLPDEKKTDGYGVFWAPGAQDGVSAHHMPADGNPAAAQRVAHALVALTRRADAATAQALTDAVRRDPLIGYVDELLDAIRNEEDLDAERLLAVAQWLARGAADRDAVKLGIALLGLFGLEENDETLLTLGRHDEFTLYAAVALSSRGDDAERLLWQLGQSVLGWGRVHVVEVLAETEDPGIRAWLLRDGYRNAVMNEYTALVCARTGGLLDAISTPEPDTELVDGAGDILTALVPGYGGPVEGIDAYEDGLAAVQRYVEIIEEGDWSLRHLHAIRAIELFVQDLDAPWEELASRGWTEDVRTQLAARCRDVRERPGWTAKIQTSIRADDAEEYDWASWGAELLDVDVWELEFARLGRPDDAGAWEAVCRTDDAARMDRIVARAKEWMPPARPASGPGRGPELDEPDLLGCVVGGLGAFPGKGEELVVAAWRSRDVYFRFRALETLSAWGYAHWPPDLEDDLRAALEVEPDAELRSRIESVLRGERVDGSFEAPPADFPFDQAPDVAAITTVGVLERGLPILLVQHFEDDGSWTFLCGTTDDEDDARVIGMQEVLDIDPTVASIADLPPGWLARRSAVGEEWEREPDA